MKKADHVRLNRAVIFDSLEKSIKDTASTMPGISRYVERIVNRVNEGGNFTEQSMDSIKSLSERISQITHLMNENSQFLNHAAKELQKVAKSFPQTQPKPMSAKEELEFLRQKVALFQRIHNHDTKIKRREG